MLHAHPEMTLRDHVVAASRLNRELIEHLDQSLIPKVHALRRETRPDSSAGDGVSGDRTIHAAAAKLLENDTFAVDVYQQLIAHCETIRKVVQELTEG